MTEGAPDFVCGFFCQVLPCGCPMKITQAILPVAGLGTRFLPWTKVVPKELLPLGNEPIIAHVVDECMDAGINDICFVISKGKESIPQYFYEDPALEAELERRGKRHLLEMLQRYGKVNFHTVYQEEQLGDGHAILQAKDWVESDAVAVLFGDDLFTGAKPGLVQLCNAHEQLQEGPHAIFALENIPREQTQRYGIAAIEEGENNTSALKKITGLVEKPKPKEEEEDDHKKIEKLMDELSSKKPKKKEKEHKDIDKMMDELMGGKPVAH